MEYTILGTLGRLCGEGMGMVMVASIGDSDTVSSKLRHSIVHCSMEVAI